MKKGEKVLIHSGTGGVGQAAINIALQTGCEVFTTVGTPEKRKFIHEHFPSIPDDHIGNSRDTSFEQMVLEVTNGAGVDIVLNSLAEEKLQASVRCLGLGGRFLEIGKFDILANTSLGMMVFIKEVSVHGILLDNIFYASEEYKMELNKLVADGLKNNIIKPLNRTVFDKDEIETAIRYMMTGKHTGKVILKIGDEEKVRKQPAPIVAEPRYYCDSKKSYLILGGLGGFGLELADWLILRGARNLVLISRTGVKTGYQRLKVDLWKSYGVNVLIITGADASNRKECEFILKSAEKQGPVDAIFNLAVVLKDSIYKNQTREMFEESFRAKVWSTKTLDELSRKLCPQLRQFVVFSSVSCGRGNAGQTNYGMANSIMERICENRAANGLPALAIQWGAIGEVGLVAEWQDNNKELVIGGTLQQKVSSCLQKLEDFLLQSRPVVASMVVAEKRVGAHGFFNIVDTVANIMGVKDLKNVAQNVSLAELGMDSMMAVEIKQTLEREYDVFLTAQDIRNLNFAKLEEIREKDEEREKAQPQGDAEETEIPGMQLLFRITGNKVITPDICMQLQSIQHPRKVEVFLLAGIEGSGHVFEPLASKIKPIAFALQYGTRHIGGQSTSIPGIADSLLPYVLSKAEERRSFALIGYSYGALIAIELARQLENNGLTGRLVLIDGAPELLRETLEQFLPSSTEQELQNNVLLSIMDTLQPASSGKLLLNLEKCTTWEQKLKNFVSHFDSKDQGLSTENQEELCNSIYSHVVALRNYDLTSLPRISTPITLLKPTQHSFNFAEEDYGLRKITRSKVDIYYVESTNHVTILDSDKVIAAINGDPLIDPKLFKKLLQEDIPLDAEEEEYTRA